MIFRRSSIENIPSALRPLPARGAVCHATRRTSHTAMGLQPADSSTPFIGGAAVSHHVSRSHPSPVSLPLAATSAPSAEQLVLNRRLETATSLDGLLELLANHLSVLNSVNWATGIHRIAKQLQAEAAGNKRKRHGSSPDTGVPSFRRPGYSLDEDERFDRFVGVMEDGGGCLDHGIALAQLRPREVGNVLWASVALKKYGVGRCDGIYRKMVEMLHGHQPVCWESFSPLSLAVTAWASVKMMELCGEQHHDRHPVPHLVLSIATFLMDAPASTLPLFRGEDVAMVLLAMGKCRVRHDGVWHKMTEASLRHVSQMTPLNLSNLLLSVVHGGYRPSAAWMTAVLDASLARLTSPSPPSYPAPSASYPAAFAPESLSNQLWCATRLTDTLIQTNAELMCSWCVVLATESTARVDSFAHSELSMALWAAGRLRELVADGRVRTACEDFIDAARPVAMRCLRKFEPIALAQVLSCYAAMAPKVDEKLFREASRRLLRLLGDRRADESDGSDGMIAPGVMPFEPHHLASLMWSYASAGVVDSKLFDAILCAISDRQWWGQLRARDLSNVMWASAKHREWTGGDGAGGGGRPEEREREVAWRRGLLDEGGMAAATHLAAFDGPSLSRLLWSCAVLELPCAPSLLHKASPSLTSTLTHQPHPQLPPADTSLLIQAFAHGISQSPPSLSSAVAMKRREAMRDVLRHLLCGGAEGVSIHGLVGCLMALARAGGAIGEDGGGMGEGMGVGVFVQRAAHELVRRSDELTVADLSPALWALARLRFSPPPSFLSAMALSLLQPSALSPLTDTQCLLRLAWSVRHLSCAARDGSYGDSTVGLLDARLVDLLVRRISHMDGSSLARLMWTYGALAPSVEPYSRLLESAASERLASARGAEGLLDVLLLLDRASLLQLVWSLMRLASESGDDFKCPVGFLRRLPPQARLLWLAGAIDTIAGGKADNGFAPFETECVSSGLHSEVCEAVRVVVGRQWVVENERPVGAQMVVDVLMYNGI
ncbi:unnamed protein product [Vitrella brassicaformis CCMP3155]|uniref:Uncharacterized protein n=1 Tax=Vitrella brassicaformis (strain CCMP3155) TaxID=1169540 RepID=A0A0G4EZB2_VITBC|nr:unnamed protein product [Vitrella brassicaformis CCMP3155]|eukprot:CEM04532.1 unnamed protein product [Vitrella brassicaformis CCMP3155]